MTVTVVGSGTVVPEADRVCSGYHLEAGDVRLLLDCGAGTLHSMARHGVAWSELTHLAVTHFHTDHTGGLPILLFSLKHALRPSRRRPLEVIGPAGTRALFKNLAAAFGDYVLRPGFELRVHELEPGAVFELGGEVRLACHETPHTPESVGYRVSADGAALGYTGDTGPSPDLGRFFEGVDVLIAECSLPESEAMDLHLTPTSLAAMAVAASPGRLLATHVFPQLPRDQVPDRLRAAGWHGETILAQDGLRLDL